MKNIILFTILIIVFTTNVSAYKFLGAKWPGSSPVVPYWFNEQGCEDVPDEWEYMHDAFNVWCDVPSTVIESKYKGMTTVNKVAADSINILKWAKGKDWPLGGNVVAVCYTWSKANIIKEFDIVFNNKNWAWSTSGQSGKMDVGAIATHEVGHALGLDHSNIQDAVMYPKVKQGDISNRTLHPDDSTGISRLYPRTDNNNHAPVITSTPITQAIAGLRYIYQVSAKDPDGDSIKFSLRIKPLNMRIDSLTGKITWFPKFLDLGSHDVILVVSDIMGKTTEQKYKITVTNLVVYTLDDKVDFGDTLYREVYVSPMDEYGVLAGNIELSYNPDEMVILELDTIGSVIAGASYAKNITSDMIKFAFAGANPFSGGGILFRIKLLVYEEHCGKNISMPIVKAFFNDGDPVATTSDGSIFMQCGGGGYQIDGKVLYSANNMGVGNAVIDLVELGIKDSTTVDGYFAFTNVPRLTASYTLKAAKDSGDTRNAISAFDASLVLRYVVDLYKLTTFKNQSTCADVNSNNMITAYDASLILRFIVQYNDATDIGKWHMTPADTTISNLTESVHNIIIHAYMIGDVSGNWNDFDSEQPRRDASSIATIVYNKFTQCDISTDNGMVKGYRAILSMKDTKEEIFSGQFDISFDNERYQLHSVKSAQLLNGYLTLHNVVDNKILIAFAGTEAISENGELCVIEILPINEFMPHDTSLNNSEITFCMFNEVKDQPVAIENEQKITNSTITTRITSVYPNPFMQKVAIQYSIKTVQHIRIDIFDLRGRVLKTLVNEKLNAGSYKTFWDGNGITGQKIGTQIYILRFQSGDSSKNIKLYKIR